MPRIHDYTQQVSAQGAIGGRRAQAGDFGTGVDTGAGLTSAADTLYDVEQRQEVSKVRTDMAQKRAEWTVNLQTAANESEIGDPNFAQRFIDKFGEDIAKSGDGIHTAAGRRAWQEATAQLTAHFTQTAGLYQAKSMGDKAVLDYKKGLDFDRNTLLLDPSTFNVVLAQSERGLDDPAGPYAEMPADKREQLRNNTRQELALSAVQGLIRQDPTEALDQLKSGKWAQYLDADKTYTMQRSAEIAINAAEVERDRIDRAKAKAQVEAQRATENEFIAKLVEDPNSLSAKEVSNSNMTPDDKLKWLGIIGKAGKPGAIKTDPAVYLDTYQRIGLPPDDPRHLGEDDLPALVGHGLRLEDVNSFRSEIQGKKTEAGRIEGELKDGLLKLAKTSLTGADPLFRIRDRKGDEQLQKFTAWFLPEYSRQRQAGKSAVDLLDPNSKDYLGKAIDQYKRPRAVFMHDLMEDNPGRTDILGTGAVPAGGPAAPRVAGLLVPGNIDLEHRPVANNADGSISTVRSMSFEENGKEVLIPTVSDDGHILSDDAAIDLYRRTGKHLGIFDNAADAEKYAQKLHEDQAKFYGAEYKSPEDVSAAYKAGKISREEAAAILKRRGWAS